MSGMLQRRCTPAGSDGSHERRRRREISSSNSEEASRRIVVIPRRPHSSPDILTSPRVQRRASTSPESPCSAPRLRWALPPARLPLLSVYCTKPVFSPRQTERPPIKG
jgi:hypothetical protein